MCSLKSRVSTRRKRPPGVSPSSLSSTSYVCSLEHRRWPRQTRLLLRSFGLSAIVNCCPALPLPSCVLCRQVQYLCGNLAHVEGIWLYSYTARPHFCCFLRGLHPDTNSWWHTFLSGQHGGWSQICACRLLCNLVFGCHFNTCMCRLFLEHVICFADSPRSGRGFIHPGLRRPHCCMVSCT